MYPSYCLALSESMKLELNDHFKRMKEMGMFSKEMTFLDFVDECFARGYNDYLKELSVIEGLNDI
jgi:hypothetical protein